MSAPDHAPHDAAGDGRLGGGLVEFSTRRRVTIAMITVTMVLFGLISLNSL